MKIINEANENRISYRLLNVMLKLEEAQERLHRYGTDTPLFAAEIHMIKCVKENPNRHMTALAEVLGVTRGAVSQIAMKLEGKGMLVKERDEDSSLRRILRVTPEGERQSMMILAFFSRAAFTPASTVSKPRLSKIS